MVLGCPPVKSPPHEVERGVPEPLRVGKLLPVHQLQNGSYAPHCGPVRSGDPITEKEKVTQTISRIVHQIIDHPMRCKIKNSMKNYAAAFPSFF